MQTNYKDIPILSNRSKASKNNKRDKAEQERYAANKAMTGSVLALET